MEQEPTHKKTLFQNIGGYFSASKDLFFLQSAEKIASIVPKIILLLVQLFLASFVIFFLTLALGFYLGHVLQNNALGFLAAAGIFFLFIILLLLLGKVIRRAVGGILVVKIMKKWNGEEEERHEN